MSQKPQWPLLLRCAPGLARVLQHEMKFRKLMERGARPQEVFQRSHDIVFLKNIVSTEGLRQMRVAEDAGFCVMHGQFKITPAQLDRAAEALSKVKLPLRLAVTADGKHFDRRDMERFIRRELQKRGVRLAEKGKMLWFFLIDGKYYLVLQEAEQDLAPFRRFRKREREGSLPPAIAAAMCFTARPQAGEVLLDPCCGSGTLLAEAYALQNGLAGLKGYDIDAEAVSCAKQNLAKAKDAAVQQGDGGATGLDAQSVDVVLANLPFGKQFGDKDDNPALYKKLLDEMQRTAKRKNWRAVLLTSDAAAFKSALQKSPELKYEEAFTVKIRGEISRCYQVTFK